MQISGQTVVRDYQALRQAAGSQEKQAILEMAPRAVELVSSQIDQDPSTTDTIVASSWDGGMSSTQARLTFRELQQDGKQVLEFTAQQPRSLFATEQDQSNALIDLASGQLISSSGSGDFLVSNSGPVVPAQPTAQEKLYASIRESYRDIQQHVAQGEQEFSAGMGEITVKESRPGYIQVESWDGGFSSAACTETFREYQDNQRAMLEYTKVDPGNPFMVGSQPETTTHRLPL